MSFRDFQIVGVLQNCTKVNVIDIQLCCCEHRDYLRMRSSYFFYSFIDFVFLLKMLELVLFLLQLF